MIAAQDCGRRCSFFVHESSKMSDVRNVPLPRLKKEETDSVTTPSPFLRPRNWVERVNTPLTAREIERVRTSIQRSRPLGSERWVLRTAERLGLGHTLRREGRPRKHEPAKN